MEITFKRPEPTTRSKGIIFPECAWMAPSIASSLGTEWPQTSASSRPTTRPRRASETAEPYRYDVTLDDFGMAPRQQGKRPTCSVFTVAGALEFAVAKRQGHTPRLSVEFLNWAANKECGNDEDGGFFSDLWKAFDVYGICLEQTLPYRAEFDPSLAPSREVLAEAKTRF